MTATIVVGLGFGDESKGSVVDYLTRRLDAKLVVRFNGGPQAAHRVVTPEGQTHIFSQLGAGSFVPGVHTFLSQYVLVNPLNLVREWSAFRDLQPFKLSQIHVHRDALVITPFHVAANRLREIRRGDNRHGSCGQGIGEAKSTKPFGIRFGNLPQSTTQGIARRLMEIQAYYAEEFRDMKDHPEYAPLENVFLSNEVSDLYKDIAKLVRIEDDSFLQNSLKISNVIFEGAQGMLLDETFGFNPYTTWSTTAPRDALELAGSHATHLYGLLRAYGTRHGPGPFPCEDATLRLSDAANVQNEWQGGWRVGHFDCVLARYAIDIAESWGMPLQLGVTHLDALGLHPLKICTSYEQTWGNSGNRSEVRELQSPSVEFINRCTPNYIDAPAEPEAFLDTIKMHVGSPIGLRSFGPTAADKH